MDDFMDYLPGLALALVFFFVIFMTDLFSEMSVRTQCENSGLIKLGSTFFECREVHLDD